MAGAEKKSRGLVIINTGNGKGKSTAAFGTALRAAGWGQKVLILQFIKGPMKTGEKNAVAKLASAGLDISIQSTGRGMIKKSDDVAKDLALIKVAWQKAEAAILSGAYDLIVLDEINIVLHKKYLSVETVCETLKRRPLKTSVILTGRHALPELINIADTVSEINEVKHAYQKGIKARKGIEF